MSHQLSQIYQTDLRHICRVGRTMAVDDLPESFVVPQGVLPWQQFLLVPSTELIIWTQAASLILFASSVHYTRLVLQTVHDGTARRANVGLCPTSSSVVLLFHTELITSNS